MRASGLRTALRLHATTTAAHRMTSEEIVLYVETAALPR
jgi:hypothetical protein